MSCRCIATGLDIERSAKVSNQLRDLSLDRMYKYFDNDPCRTYETKWLRQREKTIEYQGAPFKTGLMPISRLQPFIKPKARPKSKIKSVSLQSGVHRPSKALETSKGMEPSVFTFSNSVSPANQVTNEAHAELLSPTITSGIFSPKSDVLVLTQDQLAWSKTSLREQQLYQLRVEFDKTLQARSRLLKSS